jgi:prepilin-type N-terminal cleavage/methylation domain-containing protein
MKPQSTRKRCNGKLGFTLIELMLSLLILGVLMGAVFRQMDTAQQRMSTESIKLDDFQQARDFVDQFFRDINQIGDPNSRMFDLAGGFAPASPLINDNRLAVGLTYIDANEIHFEGSVNGIGTVQSVIYKINGTGTCALCMQRSQVDKIVGNPVNGQSAASWGTEVNDVIATPIFQYYQADGTLVSTLPADLNGNANLIANIKTIKISLVIRNPAVLDIKTGQPIETNFEGEVSLNNCSMAATSQPMSCN